MNPNDMIELSPSEAESVDGGGSTAGAVLIGVGTAMGCWYGGGAAFGAYGAAGCGTAGVLAALIAAAS